MGFIPALGTFRRSPGYGKFSGSAVVVTAHHNTSQHDTSQHITANHDTSQHDTSHHSTIHSTTQRGSRRGPWRAASAVVPTTQIDHNTAGGQQVPRRAGAVAPACCMLNIHWPTCCRRRRPQARGASAGIFMPHIIFFGVWRSRQSVSAGCRLGF
jgi:hypothetical protein